MIKFSITHCLLNGALKLGKTMQLDKRMKLKQKFLLYLIPFFAFIASANAQTTYTWNNTSGGDWGTASNWTPSRNTPAITDNLQFTDGNTYIVTGVPSQTIRQLLVNSNTNVSLQSSSAAIISVNGPTLTDNIVISNGSTLQLSSTGVNSLDIRIITTASQRANISGNLIINANGTNTNSLTTNTVGTTVFTINNTGAITNNGGLFTTTTATLVFAAGSNYYHACDGGQLPTATWNATSNCNITGIVNANIVSGLTGAFGHITWNCPSQASAQGYISGALTINGNLTVTAGTFSASSFVITGNAGGTINVANGATLEIGNGAASTNTFPSNFVNANINLVTGSTIVYNSTGAQTVSGVPNYNNLVIRGTGVRTLGAATNVNGNLSIEANATLNTSTFQIAGNATGTFTMAANANMQIGAATAAFPNFPSAFTAVNITLHPSSTVNYSTITGTQNVAGNVAGVGPASYGNLTITGATGTKQLTGNTSVAGIFNINGANTFNDGGNILTVNGNLSNTGSHTGAGSISLAGGTSSHVFTGTGAYNNLSLNDIQGASMSSAFTINGLLTLTTGNFNILGQTLTLAGTFTATGGALAGLTTSIVSINGTGAFGTLVFDVASANLSSLNINRAGPGTVNLGTDLILNANGNALTLSTGRLILGTKNITLSSVSTISGGSVNAMVVPDGTGELRKTFVTPITFTFPVGDITGTVEYSPVTLTTFTTDITRTIGVKLTNAAHPNDGGSTHRANRYWVFSDDQAGSGNYTYSATFTNVAADLVGTYANISVGFWDGATWSQIPNTIATPGMAIGANSQFTARLGGRAVMGRTAALVGNTYTWLPTSGSHDFNDPTKWSPARNTAFTTDILQFNSGGTSTAINVPTQTVTRILVSGTTDITFQSNAANTFTINGPTATTNLSIAAGSTFQVSNNTSTSTLLLNFGAITGQLGNVAGILRVNLNGTFTTTATNPVTFAAGSTYQHDINGGTIPTGVTWNSSSNLNITGITSTNPANFTGTYGNVIWNCIPSQTASGSLSGLTTIVGNLTITSGTFSITTNTLNIAGNLVNNSIFGSTSGVLVMNGTAAQTISGSGSWIGNVNGAISSLTINNAAGVSLNTNFAIQNSLTLTAGVLSGTGTLTLGIGNTSTLTTTITGGSIAPLLNMGYSLFNVTYNLNYNNTVSITTSGELPPLSTTAPVAGIMTIGNGATVVMSNDGLVFSTVINNAANSILRLNGKTLRMWGSFTNNTATINTMGLDASVANSKLSFVGNTLQTASFGNQTFGGVVTAPDLDINNTFSGYGASGGQNVNGTGTVKNINVLSGSFLQIGNFTLNVKGDITNNGSIMANGSNTGALISMIGTAAQSISGTGTYLLYTTHPGTGIFPGLQIFNTSGATPAVSLNQNLALQNTLNLYQGSLGGSGTLTLGNASNAVTFTVNIGSGTNPGGSIQNSLSVAYNLSNMNFSANYNILSPTAGYTTGKELPNLAAAIPIGGTVTIFNTNAAGVTLGLDAKVYNWTINNSATLHLNGKTLQLAGSFVNNSAVANTGLNSSVANSKLHFIGNMQQSISLNNQTFAGIITTPDLEISNTFYNGSINCAATVTTTANTYVKNVIINGGSYLQINGVNLNIAGNFTNNGLLFSSGASSTSLVTMNGTALQTISGTGLWSQILTNPANDAFPGFCINNTSGLTPSVNLNQDITLQNQLLLSAGNLSGTGTITLGNGMSGQTFTMNAGILAGTSSGGSINNAMTVNYNLVNMTFTGNYYALTPAGGYTTGKELPSFVALPPNSGTVSIINTNAAGITLGNDATVFTFAISNNAIFHLNGKTLRLAGNFTNSAAAANTGLNSSVAGSKLFFIGNSQQTINFGNQTFAGITIGPDLESSNFFYNATAGASATLNSIGTVNNILINTGAYLQNGNFQINVQGNVTNNGLIYTSGSNTGSIFNFNGTGGLQTISGTGNWNQILTNGGNDMFPGFLINNASGVVLNQNVQIQNRIDLLINGGILSGTGILTIGNGINNTLTINRSFGAINMTNPVQYNLSGVTYNLNYNATAAAIAITTGAELPPLSYTDYKLGTLTNNNSIANGGVIMGASSNINTFNNTTGNLFDLNNNNLNIFGTYTNNGTLNGSSANARLGFIGVIAQSITLGTLTSAYLSNATINNPAGVTFNTSTQIGSSGSNGNLNLILGTLTQTSGTTLTVYGTFSGNGTLASGSSNASLSLQGSSGNMGTINLLNGAQTFPNFTMNVTGASPNVIINGSLNISTAFTLTSGVVKMGVNAVNYNAVTTTPMLIANQNSSSYFEFNGASSGLAWNMTSVAAGTYRWPIGISGLSDWRPVTIQTLATAGNPSNAKIGYVGTIAGAGYNAYDIAAADTRSNYIALLNTSGNLGTPNLTLEYQTADFNIAPSAASAVNIYYYNIPAGAGTSQWTSTGAQTSNGTNGSNTTIVKNGAINLTSGGFYPLNLAESNSDPGTATTTFIWTGTTSTSWNGAVTNWNPNPSSVANSPGMGTNVGVNVIIPQVANQPTATGLALSLNNVNIGNGAILTLASTTNMTLSGNLINNNFNGSSNGLTWSGTPTVTYTGTSKLIGPGNYYNLTFSGSTTPILSPIGTINVANTFTPVNAGVTSTGSTIWFNGSTQTIPSYNFFNHVIFGNGGATHTLSGQISIAGDLTINTTLFIDGGNQIIGPGIGSGTFTILAPSARTYNGSYAGAKALPDFQNYNIWGNNSFLTTFNFSGANTGVQTFPATTYGTMNLTNGGLNKKTAAGDMVVRGNFTLTSGSFDDGGYTVSLYNQLNNNVAVGGASSGITSTGAGKIVFSGGLNAHAISSIAVTPVSFGNIELNDGLGATWTSNGAVTNVVGNLTITTGTLTLNSFVTSFNVSGNTTIMPNGTLLFPIVTGTRNFNHVIVNGNWNETSAPPIVIAGDLENNGTITANTGTHTFSGTAKEIRGNNFIAIPNVAMTGTYTNKLTGSYNLLNGGPSFIANGGFRVTTSWNAGAGTLTQFNNALLVNTTSSIIPSIVASASGNTVVYNSGTLTTIKTPSGGNYYNLILNPTGATTYNLSGATNINNNFTFYPSIAGATFADATFLLTGPGAGTGALDMNSPFTNTVNLTNTALTPVSPFPSFNNYVIGINNTVNYNAGVAQDLVNSSISNITFGNLTIGGAGIKTARQTITVLGNLTTNGGGMADNGNTITVNGGFSGSSAHTSTGAGKVLLAGGTQPHNIGRTGAIGNLELDDVQGAIVAAAFQINGNLALKNGNFYLGASITTTLNGTTSYPAPGGFLAGNIPVGSTSILNLTGTGTLGDLKFASDYQNIATLTMNRTATGLVNLGTDLTLNTTLNLTNGRVNLGNNNLYFGPAATSTAGSTANHIIADATIGTGRVYKYFPSGGGVSFTYPIGDNTGTSEYSPLSITSLTPQGGNRAIGVRVTDADHPQNIAGQPNRISRFWNFDDIAGTSTGYNYNSITLNYIAGAPDNVGTLNTTNNQINLYSNVSTSWLGALNNTVTVNTTQAAATAPVYFNEINSPFNNTDVTLRLNNPTTYTWLPTSGSADWTLASNWTPARTNPGINDILLFNQSGTSTAYNVPTQTIAQFLVSNNTDITLQASTSNILTINGATATINLSVASGSTLQISSASYGTMTLLYGSTTGQLASINGTLIVNNNGIYTPTNAITTFGAGSFYTHNRDGGTVPNGAAAITWNASSTCNITGCVITNPTGLATTMTYGNFTYNSPGVNGAFGAAMIISGNLTVSNGIFTLGGVTHNLRGNLVNNAIINSASNLLVFDGTSAQTVSGSGQWTTSPSLVNNAFNGITINNAAGVIVNGSFALQSTLNLTLGNVTGSGTLTLGNGSPVTLTTTVTNGTIDPSLAMAYNLNLVTYNLTYNNSTAAYTTGGELPSLAAVPPFAGTMTVNNNQSLTLGNNGTIYNVTINSLVGNILHLNGKTLRVAGNFANNALAINTMGLNASITNSKLHFIGTNYQTISLGNQTFTIPGLTSPDIEISNNFFNNTTSSGASVTGTGSVKNVLINASSYLQIGGVNLNVTGDITNNGILFTSGANTASLVTLTGSIAQIIGGSGTWNQIVTNPGVNRFTGLAINNISGANPAVSLNQSFALQNTLTLTNGILDGSGTLTLGNGSFSTLTGIVTNGTIPLGSLTMAYNLSNATYNLTYNNSTVSYNTGGELPVIATTAPLAGALTFNNNQGVVLNNNVCFYNATINSLAGNIFNLNGSTMRLTGNFANNALTLNTMGLNASIAGSKLTFESNNPQTFTTGNQTFGGVPNGPDVEVNNSNAISGLNLSTANAYINNLIINASDYFQYTGNSNLYVAGSITNNGLLFIPGANTTTNLIFNGNTAQTISGTGIWSQTGTNAGNGRFTNFTINNNSGATPAVILNQNIALQNSLYLQLGQLGGTGTLTYGQGTGTFLMTRTAGSMNASFNPSFAGLINTIFNVNYGNSLAPLTITTGNEIPYAPAFTQTINNFTCNFNAVGGEITLGDHVAVGNNGTLSLTNTRLYLASKDFTLNNIASTIGGTFGINNMIVADGAGQLKRVFAIGSTAAFTFPVGDNSGGAGNNAGLDYSPLSLTISSNSNVRTIGINLVDGQHPNDVTVNNYISRYWNVSDNLNGAGSYNYASTFTYSILPTSDLVGTQTLASANWWNGSDWNAVTSTYPANGFTISGQNQNTAPLGAASSIAYTGRVNPPQIYVWQPVTGTHDWNDPSKWLPNRYSPQVTDVLKFTQGGTSTANNIPTQTISQFEVSGNTNINWISSTGGVSTLSVNGPTLTDNIFIDNGSTLQLSSGGTSSINLTMLTTASQRANISGTFIANLNTANNNTLTTNGVASNLFTVYPTGVIQNNGGTFTSSATTFVFGNASTYNHNMDGGALPTATWYNAVGPVISNINVTGTVATAPSNQNQTFGNYTWNGLSNQTGAANLTMSTTTIQGDFNINSTGSGSIIFNNNAAGTINVNGNFNLIAGDVFFNNTGASVTSFNLAGNYNQTGGTLQRGTGTGTTHALNFTNSASNKTFTNSGTFTTTGIAINVNLNAIVTLNDNIVSNQSFTNSGTLFMQNKIISGTGTFTHTNATTATLGIGDADGITTTGGTIGNVQVTGTKSYGSTANYIYNGGIAQVSGNALTTCNNLTIDNSAGVTQQNAANTTQNVTITNLLTLTNGVYQIGGISGNLNSLTLNGPAIAGTASNLASTNFSNLIFGGAQPGINIPSSIVNLNALTIGNTNTQGVTLNSNLDLQQSTAGVLTLNASSRLFLGANNLTIASNAYTATIGGTFSATSMVVADGAGKLRKNFGTSGFAAFTFPIGDNSGGVGNNPGFDYAPFAITFATNSQDRIIGVNVTDAEHPSNAGVTDYASRYWSVYDSELGNGTYSYLPLSLSYSTTATSDVNGSTALYRVNRFDGASWSQFNSTVSAPTVTTSVSNTHVTGTLGGNEFAIRFNPQQTYEWIATSGSALWTDPTSWNPSRFSPQANDVLLFNQGGTSTATGVPTETVAQILFSNTTSTTFVPVGTNTLSLNGATLTNNLVIASACVLTIENGLTFNYLTTASQRGSITGTLNVNTGSTFNTSSIGTTIVTVNSGGVVNHNGGTFTTTAATLVFAASSNYNHNITAGTIPTATWNTSSTVSILSPASGTLAGLAQSFGNFTLNTGAAIVTTMGASITGVTGNLNINAGVWNDNNFTITGNAAGLFAIGANGTYTTSRTTTPWLPTAYVTANITLDPLSTVNYNGNGTFTIPTTQYTSYGKFTIGVGGVKTLGGAISVQSLDINAGTLADGGFQISGNATGTLNVAASAILQIGTGATSTLFPTNFVTANINLNATSTVIYNSTTAMTMSSTPSSYGHLTMTGANTKSDGGGTINVAGNINNGAGSTHIGAGKIVLIGGSVNHTLSGTGSYNNLDLNDVNGASMSASFAINGELGLINGAYTIGALTLTLNGSAINQTAGTMATTTSSNLVFAPVTNANSGLFIPSSVSDLNSLTVNIAASNSVTLNTALNVNAASNALVLTSGKVITSSSNLLTIVNTAVASLSGGSASSYVSGPLARNFPSGLSNVSTYRFPIGKADFNQVELLNLSTTSTGTLTAEVFDANAGGTFGSGVVEVNTNRYWYLNPSSSFISGINVRLTETVAGVGNANRVTQSSTLTGSYNSVGGLSVVGPPPTIASTTAAPGPVNTSLGYFVLGNTGMTYTSSTVIHPTLAAVTPGGVDQQILRIVIVTAAGTPALTLNSIDFSTLGTSDPIDILNAKVYSTGSSTTFSTTTQFGSTLATPSGAFNVAGSQALITGNNYFWLTYDVDAAAKLCNVVDAICSQINLNTGGFVPTVTAPAGSRAMNYTYCTPGTASSEPCFGSDYYITAVNIVNGGNNYFSYSGGNCLGSPYINLSGNNYDGPASPMIPGNTYTWTVTRGGTASAGKRVRIFIDWNNDGDLSDGNESIMNTTGAATVTFTVPPTSPAGCHRMRVAMGTVGADPCDAGVFNLVGGEWRDYSITMGIPCTVPLVQATNFGYNTVTTTSTNITFDRGDGNGGVIVVARQGSAVNTDPLSGTTYTANSVFGSGTQIGTGNYVVYQATGAGAGLVTVPVSGLTPGATYHFAVYEYNALSTCYLMDELAGLVNIPICMPPTIQASGVTLGTVTTTSQVLNWSSDGNGDAGVFVVLHQATPVSSDPTQTTVYTDNSVFGSGSLIGASNYVVYQGTAGTVNITGLTLNTTYYYSIYSKNSSGPCYMTPALTGSFTTLNGPMVYVSSTTVQQTGTVPVGSVNQAIIQVQVVVGPGSSPSLDINSITFNTSGSNFVSDINSARIFYTGNSTTFSTLTQFGADVINPSGSHVVTGLQTLLPGTNYFWVAYDISMAAVIGNAVDAQCTAIDYGTAATPSVTAPAGNRPISSLSNLACGYNLGIYTPSPTWTSISGGGGTVVVATGGTIDDQRYMSNAFPTGFTFDFNGVLYNSFNINANGYIFFSAVDPGNISNPISNATSSFQGVISALGANIQAHTNSTNTPQILVQYSGVAPNRVATIEWRAMKPQGNAGGLCFGLSDFNRYDFQIKLYEHGGTLSDVIDIIHKDQNPVCIGSNSMSAQIGLRGVSNTEFRNILSSGNTTAGTCSEGTVNTHTVAHGSLNWFDGNTRFRYTPTILIPPVSPAPTAANICPSATVTLSTTSPVATKQWYKDGFAISGATSSTYVASQTGNYIMAVFSGGCGKISETITTTITPCFPVWVGGTVGFETDWNTPTNWSGNLVPTINDSAVIPVRPFLPFISLGVNAVAEYVTLETDGTLLIDAGKSLTIATNGQFINNSGTVNNLGAGKVIFNGAGTIAGTNTTQFGDLELNAATALSTIPTVAGSLILNAGSSISATLNYTNTATLVYNQGGSVSTGNEWIGNSNVAGNGVPHHVTIQNASLLTLPSSDRGIAGNMNIQNGSLILNLASGDFYLGGNWIRNATSGTLVLNNRRIIFNGTTNQTIEVNTPIGNEIFYQLEVNKSAGNLQIITGTNLAVQNELILTDGKFDLNGNQLTLGTSGNNGTLTGGGATNYIISQSGTSQFIRYTTTAAPTTYLFPLGDATGYTPISVTMNNAISVNADTRLQSSMTTSAHPNLGSSTNYLSRYWTVEPIGLAGTPLYGVEYIYKDADVTGVEAQIKPFKHGTTTGWLAALGSGALYEQGTGSVNPGTNTITWTGLSSFSDFTGNGNGSPLPINLLEFNATPLVEAVELTWTTATETNNDFFTLERAKDALNFEVIHIEDGAGNSNQILNYSWIDTNPFDGYNYYRLKQTDFDGAYTYSMLRVVNFNIPESSSSNWVNVFPNPIINNKVYLNFGEIESEKVVVTFYNLTGQVVWQQKITAVSNKTSELKIEGVSHGLYYIHILNGSMVENKKIMIK